MSQPKFAKQRPAAGTRKSTQDAGKQVIIMKGDDNKQPTIDNLSLASLGAYMFFEDVYPESTKDLCEFIIKSNFVFPADQVLTIMINSPGGDVYDGFGVIDLMESSRLEIQTVGIGVIASMASLMFISGTKGRRVMSKNAYMMTHQFSDYFEGKYHEMIASRPHLDDVHERFVEHYAKNTKMSAKQVNDVLLNSSDKWISAKDCLKLGICDKIQDPWG